MTLGLHTTTRAFPRFPPSRSLDFRCFWYSSIQSHLLCCQKKIPHPTSRTATRQCNFRRNSFSKVTITPGFFFLLPRLQPIRGRCVTQVCYPLFPISPAFSRGASRRMLKYAHNTRSAFRHSFVFSGHTQLSSSVSHLKSVYK